VPTHRILQGDTSRAARYLPFARNYLARLKENTDAPFAKLLNLDSGAVKIRMAFDGGEQDFIRIKAETGRIITYSMVGGARGFLQKPPFPLSRVQNFFTYPNVDFVPSFDFAFTIGFLGNHETLFFLFDTISFIAGTYTLRVYRSRVNYGITADLILTQTIRLGSSRPQHMDNRLSGPSDGFELAYAGLVRDGDGRVTGKRLVIKTGEQTDQETMQLLISEDTGDTWAPVTFANPFVGDPDFVRYSGLSFVGDNTLLVVGVATKAGGGITAPITRIFRSADGGFTWAESPAPALPNPTLGVPVLETRFIPLGNARVLLLPIPRTGSIDACLLSTDNGANFDTLTADFPSNTPVFLTLLQSICLRAAKPARPSVPATPGEVVLAMRASVSGPDEIRYYRSSGDTFSWAEFPAPVAPSSSAPYLRVSALSLYLPGVLMVRAYDPDAPTAGVFAFTTKGDFSGWNRGGRLGDLGPGSVLAEVSSTLENVGGPSRPQPVNAALPLLYANPV
jgi:hypothetical protein